jgi:membrane protein DedA with SNARE-associated domain
MIVVPVVFTVVSSIIIAGLLASLGALMGHNTFVSCFQDILGNVAFVMTIITLFMWLVYVITEK